MKIFFYICIGVCIILYPTPASPQESEKATNSKWNHSLETYFYFMKDDFLFLPIYAADKGSLHLEARYNYEDQNTFSTWLGYNFSGGINFQYTITPMTGFIVGNTNGIAPGLEMDLEFNGFELYSESEYVFDLQDRENNFYYNWTDLTYSPKDWFWFGLSGQRTKLYQTGFDIQHGLLAGGNYKGFNLSGYLYNLESDDFFFLMALSVTFPEN